MNAKSSLLAASVVLASASPGVPSPVTVQSSAQMVEWSRGDHRSGVTSVALSPDGSQVLSAGIDRTVRLWDAATGAGLRTYRHHQEEPSAVEFLTDGEHFVSAGFDGRVTVVAIEDGEVVRELEGFRRWPLSLAVSPDGSIVAVGTAAGEVVLWRTSSGERIGQLEGGVGGPALVWSRDGGRIAGAWSRASVWELGPQGSATHALEVAGHGPGTRGLAFSPDGSRLASVGLDKTLRVWDLATGEQAIEVAPEGFMVAIPDGLVDAQLSVPLLAVAYTPDGSRIVTGGSDRMIRVWDAANGELLRARTGHTGSIVDLALSVDGSWVVSAGLDGTVRRWSLDRDDPDRPAEDGGD